ncbi:MAG: dTDP-4-dehydrorhamnose reductase [Betaproteobacteria bacterium]|nr:dTDP-4-dehydrorhamnose reductase [Betaproteobacteria bacterium]
MRILITGRRGQVGWELARALPSLGEVTALGHDGLDLADAGDIRAKISALRPDVIVNAAAYTAVGRAESEPDLAHAVNARAPGVLAEEAARCDALLVHYSTDYVFDGTKTSPYVEDDAPNPLSVYGRSKLAGERAVQASGCRHIILRTAWVYAARGKNFLLTILRLAAERPELRVVDDQFGAPTSAPSIAGATAAILDAVARGNGAQGVFHLAAAGRTTWHGFATLVVGGMPPPRPIVLAIPSSEYPTAARRPGNSCLDTTRLSATFGIRLRDWREEAQRVLTDLHATATLDHHER